MMVNVSKRAPITFSMPPFDRNHLLKKNTMLKKTSKKNNIPWTPKTTMPCDSDRGDNRRKERERDRELERERERER